jgi:CHAT domain-containing protein/tetratricopeptide (TPR) repeat protein
VISVYRAFGGSQSTRGQCSSSSLSRVLAITLLLLAWTAVHGAPATVSCSDVLALRTPALREHLATLGTVPAQAAVTLAPGHEWLIEAREQGNDAILELRDSDARPLAQADHPERRTGTRRIIFSPSKSQSLTLRVAGKEHEAVNGTVDILVIDLAALSSRPACLRAYRSLAAADSEYAFAQQITLGRPGLAGTAAPRAHDAYLHAAQEYLAAQALLDDPADAALRGETALALAGIRYFDLQDWRAGAQWAATAEKLLASRDSYRHARAEALAAAAWMEMATNTAPRTVPADPETTARDDMGPKELLLQARRTLRRLFAFHIQRRERYDAALQLNNIALAYSYESRYHECTEAARSASQMFASLHEAPRRALASQNQAVCQWGLGHLPQALDAFKRALEDLKPDPYPQLYLLTLNNTALINYALGHFDDSLRLHDRSLELAVRTQNPREEAQSLYGIGVTYYALGDRDQAREFLERSLAIRTAVLDGRGRRASLRALATVYADHREYPKAIELDREALTLATAPTPRARTRVQLAIHTALEGHSDEALQMLAELIAAGDVNDPLISAEARLERAVIERRGGSYQAALGDLSAAMPILGRFGSVTDGFTADLERARVLQLIGHPTAALAAADHALARAEDIRTQTANPELRAQLQLPLRAAFDLKLDLLWEKFDVATRAGDEREAARMAAVAFRTADAARARSFADIAAQQYSPALRRDLAQDLARREALYRNLAGMRFALDSRIDRHGSADSRVRQYAGEIAGLRRQIDTLNNAIAARTGRKPPGAAAPIAAYISPSHLPADVAIIAYWIGSDAAYAWAVTPAGIHWVRLKAPATLTESARAFHDALNGLADVPLEQRIETSSVLYAAIVRPIEDWISSYRRWFFIPDAALDYVPFAALRADAQAETPYVVARHDIALAPAAWRLLAPPPVPASRPTRMLLVSDPVYERSDPRLNPSDAPHTTALNLSYASLRPEAIFRRIPGTAREAAAIETQFPAAQVDALSGVQASRERLLQLDWSQYRFIHIASHGYVDAGMPQLSALILSAYDEHGAPIEPALRAADITSLTLTADVAVFSGCNSALGKDVLNEGMVGLAYTTLARGAGAVVSSLWQVPDEMGANLMTEFYRHLVRDSMSPLSALSASMRSVLDRNPAADPALWAAFQVSVLSVGEPAHLRATPPP